MKDKIQGFIGVVLILIIYPLYSIYLFIKLVYQLICNLFTPLLYLHGLEHSRYSMNI